MNDNNKQSVNPIVYQGGLHWILFVAPITLLIVILVIAYSVLPLRQASLILALLSMIWIGMVALRYAYTSLLIKQKQVILCTGILVRQTLDIPLAKIASIDIRQSILGSIFQYGVLIITGTGGTRQSIEYLKQPLTCRRYIEQLMHES